MKNLIKAVIALAFIGAPSVGQAIPLDQEFGMNLLVQSYSVALGDIDNDGDLDMAMYDGELTVYYNQNGKLESTPSWTAKSQHLRNLAFGDINGDGFLDLAGAGNAGPQVWLNNNGVLQDDLFWKPLDSVSASFVALGDVDGDGDLDLACSTVESVHEYRRVRLYLNNAGTFSDLPDWRSKSNTGGLCLAWGDMDNDGDLDLALGASGPAIFKNKNGNFDSTFSWQSDIYLNPPNLSFYTADVAWADINGDGYLDLVCGNGFGSPSIYHNILGTIPSFATWTGADSMLTWSIAIGDIDSDGDLELACGNENNNVIYDNNNGTLSSTPDWVSFEDATTRRLAFGDLDSDGDLDLVTANERVYDGATSRYAGIYFNQHRQKALEDGAAWRTEILDDYNGASIAWGDVDNDGDADLAVAPSKGAPLRLYLSTNGVLSAAPDWYSADINKAYRLAWGDINNDGFLDLACANRYGIPNRIYMNVGGVLESTASWTSGEYVNSQCLTLGDYDNDGDLDLAVGGVAEPDRLYNNNNGSLDTTSGWISADNIRNTWDVDWVDFDHDGDLDLISGGYPSRIYVNHNGIIEDSASVIFGSGPGFDWGDFDADGDLDVAVAGENEAIYLNDRGKISDTPLWRSNETDATSDVVFGDLDGDGDLDLAFADGGGVAPTFYDRYKVSINDNGLLEDLEAWESEDQYINVNLDWIDVDNDGDLDLSAGSIRAELNYNTLRDCNAETGLTNNRTCLSQLHVSRANPISGPIQISFVLTDLEGDPSRMTLEYSSLGGGFWEPGTTIEDVTRLSSSPAGETHTITWDTDTDNVGGYDVWIRLAIISNPSRCGLIQWPAQRYLARIGYIDGRPNISILYPRPNSIISDSIVLLGSIADATNSGNFVVSLGLLPDTMEWTSILESSSSFPNLSHLSNLDLTGIDSGNYIFRTEAFDIRGNKAISDRNVTITTKEKGAPSVIAIFPRAGSYEVPNNAPIVVQFDKDINPLAINNTTFQLLSDVGDTYSDAAYEYSSKALTIKPEKFYTPDRFHHFVVSGVLTSQDGISLGGEYVSSFFSSTKLPTENIDSLVPDRGQIQTPVNSDKLLIFYNKPSKFQYVTVFSLAGDTVVNDTIMNGWEPGSVPISRLLPKTYYLVRVSDSPLFHGPSDYMSYFITEDTDQPVVIDVRPSDNDWLIGLTEAVEVTFSKTMNVHTVDTSSFKVIGPNGSVRMAAGFGSVGDSIFRFEPATPYLPATRYAVSLSSHIQDNIGNKISPLTWTFTTGTFDTVGYAGKTVDLGGFNLYFPPGSINTETEIGAGMIPRNQLTLPPDIPFADVAIDVTPAISLQREAVLSLQVSDSLLDQFDSPDKLKLYRYNDIENNWEYLGGTLADGVLSSSIPKLGRFGLFESNATVASVDFAKSLVLTPRVIAPRMGGNARELNISFALSAPQDVLVNIYDMRGRLVKSLGKDIYSGAGENLLSWDGRGQDGSYAEDGLYVLLIEAEGRKAQKTFVILNK